MSSETVLHVSGLGKSFHDGKRELDILKNVDLSVQPGEQVAILGASGSGKSTLLQILGGLDKPCAGDVLVKGKNIHGLTENARSDLRNKALGFIYQFHHLLREFTALENVCMPLLIRGDSVKSAVQQARALLEEVGLGQRLEHKPGSLSGGEKQRVAIARALVTNPACVLADEPTGNLDKHTAEQVYNTMLAVNQRMKTSLVIVTHDLHLAEKMDCIFTLEDGVLQQGVLA